MTPGCITWASCRTIRIVSFQFLLRIFWIALVKSRIRLAPELCRPKRVRKHEASETLHPAMDLNRPP